MGRISGKSTDGPVSRLINRRISTRITRVIVSRDWGVTPTQISFMSFLLGVLSAAVIAYLSGPLGGILVQFSSIIDGVDGELARARGLVSRKGGFLDSMLDRLVDIAVILAVAYRGLAQADPVLVLVLGISASTGALLVSYLHGRGEAALGIHPALIGSVPPLASRDVRLFLVMLGCLAEYYVYTLAVLAGLSYAYVTIKLLEIYVKQ